MPGTPSFAAEAVKTCSGAVLGMLLLLALLLGSHLLRTGSPIHREVSDERCIELWNDHDGYDEKTGKDPASLWFGLSCDDRPRLDHLTSRPYDRAGKH